MPDGKEYNGWSSYETWLVSLWIDNEQSTYHYWRDVAREVRDNATPNPLLPNSTALSSARYELGQRLQSEIEDGSPLETGLYCDLLNGAFSEIDWYEIAEHWLDEIGEDDDEDD